MGASSYENSYIPCEDKDKTEAQMPLSRNPIDSADLSAGVSDVEKHKTDDILSRFSLAMQHQRNSNARNSTMHKDWYREAGSTHEPIFSSTDREKSHRVSSDIIARLATRAANIGIWDYDIKDNILVWDDQMFALYGAVRSDFSSAADAWISRLHPDDLERCTQEGMDAIAGAKLYCTEFRIKHTDGFNRVIKAIADVFCDAEGVAVRMVGVNWDVTELAYQNEEKKKRADELTLANIELSDQKNKNIQIAEEARLDAEHARCVKAQFLANMSHELRTPLNGIIGVVDILKQTPLKPDQELFISLLETSSLSLLGTLNDILDYSRLEAGRMTIKNAPMALLTVIDSVVKLMRIDANAKSLKFNVSIAPNLPRWIDGDAARLRQILLNLLGNATKFTRNRPDHIGQIQLSVELDKKIQNFPGLVLRVIDNGIGISTESMPYVFHSFTQVDESTTRKVGGVGLGLSICEKLVSLMGGEIKVMSTEGAGSEFVVTLPLKIPPSHEMP